MFYNVFMEVHLTWHEHNKKLKVKNLSLLEFSYKDGMQVDLKSECFTPESRPNKDFTRDSQNSN